ncbi:RICIN domain-containing protein [Vibrio sp. PP-XX7]
MDKVKQMFVIKPLCVRGMVGVRGMIAGAVLMTSSLLYSGWVQAGYCTDAPANGKTYKLVNEGSGLTMEVTGLSTDDGVQIIQQPSSGSLLSQQYLMVDTGDGNWRLQPQHSHKVIAEDASSQRVIQKAVDQSVAQKWTISQTSTGSFTIVSSQSHQLLTAANNEKGAFIVEQPNHHSAYQHWYFNPVADSDHVENIACRVNSLSVKLNGGAMDGQVALTWENPTQLGSEGGDTPISAGDIDSLKIYVNSSSDPKGRKLVTSIRTTKNKLCCDWLGESQDSVVLGQIYDSWYAA